jgi:hypothetical protein
MIAGSAGFCASEIGQFWQSEHLNDHENKQARKLERSGCAIEPQGGIRCGSGIGAGSNCGSAGSDSAMATFIAGERSYERHLCLDAALELSPSAMESVPAAQRLLVEQHAGHPVGG